MSRRRLLLAALLLGLIGAFFLLDLGQYFQIEFLRSKQAGLEEFRRSHPLALGAIFFLIYVAVCAVSLPGAAVMSLVVGAIFGLGWGTLIVSFASSIGATLAFLSSRFLFREWVRSRFGSRLRTIDAGLEKEGAFYLFALRIVPAVPYVVTHLLMGLTPVKTWTYYWVSQIGMLPGTMVYINAGTQLGTLSSIRGLFSPELLGSFVLLGIFPILAKKVIGSIKTRRALGRRRGGERGVHRAVLPRVEGRRGPEGRKVGGPARGCSARCGIEMRSCSSAAYSAAASARGCRRRRCRWSSTS